ncbi:9143_t:CDS:2 [Racocetra persica]|uniref:9143_t:CDS:1 n=1 Tax=Racocetra persica TaxID=160502 RepID=A0ACA9MAC4_9GLOM|nr:9143_t:CDS:2 [Racocetra persica]
MVYKDHKNHPTIACYSGSLFLTSLASSLIGFIRLIQNSKSEQSIICSLQGVLIIYVTLASDIWPVCIAFNVWVQFNSNSLQGRDRWSIRMLLFVYAIISWGVPVFLTFAASIKSIMNGDMISWPNYCFPTPSGIHTAIFLICVAAMTTTLAFSVRNVILTIKYDTGQLGDSLVINRINFVWVICADFAMSATPWITFVFFGTTSEAVRKYLPRFCFSYKDNDKIPVRPSMIDRKSINTSSFLSHEPSLDDSTVVTEEKGSPQTPQHNFAMPGGSSVSTFSQRVDPNSPDPFSHRKNPSLTIKIDPIRPADDSKMANSRVSRVRKGKERATAIKKSFLYKTYADGSNDDYGSKNQDSSKNKKVDVSRGKSSAFHETAMPNRRSPRQTRHTITEGSKIQSRDIMNEPVRFLLKQFSFEKRHKSESIIKIPLEFGIKTYSHHSLLSIPSLNKVTDNKTTDNHVENVMSSSSTSQIVVTDDSQNIMPLPQSLSSLIPQTGLSAPPRKSSKESMKKQTINYPPNFYLTVNNGSLSTNATFGSQITPNSMVTGIVNSSLDQNLFAESSNNLSFRSPSLKLPSTPSFGTMAVHSTQRTNTQSSSSSKSSKTSSNNRSSAGTTRSSNGFTLTPRGSYPFNTTRPVTNNDNGSSSLAFDDENEERMGELRRIVEEFNQSSFKTQDSSL